MCLYLFCWVWGGEMMFGHACDAIIWCHTIIGHSSDHKTHHWGNTLCIVYHSYDFTIDRNREQLQNKTRQVNLCSFAAILFNVRFIYFPVLCFCPTCIMLFSSMSYCTRNNNTLICCSCFVEWVYFGLDWSPLNTRLYVAYWHTKCTLLSESKLVIINDSIMMCKVSAVSKKESSVTSY